MISTLLNASEVSTGPDPKLHVRFTGDPNWLPFEAFDPSGQYIGIVADHLALIENQTNIVFEKVKPKSWQHALDLALGGAVDIISGDIDDATLRQHFDPVKPYFTNDIVIVMHQRIGHVQSLDTLAQKSIAIVQGYGYTHKLYQQFPHLHFVEVNTVQEGLKGVASGKYDAMFGTLAMMSYQLVQMGLSDLAIVGDTGFAMELTLFVRKSSPELFEAVSGALASIDAKTQNAILSQWYHVPQMFDQQRHIKLNSAERAWIAQHPKITYTLGPWSPLSIIQQQSVGGIISAYLHIIANATGLQFDFIPAKTDMEAYSIFSRGEAQITTTLDTQADSLGLLSDPFSTFAMVIVTNENIPYVDNPERIARKRIAIERMHRRLAYLKSAFPDADFLETETISEALKKVAYQEADAYIGHLAAVLEQIDKNEYGDLKIAGRMEALYEHRFMISAQYPELHSIINKVLASIDEHEREAINDDWVHVSVEEAFDYTLLWKIGAFILLLFAIFAYYNRKLNHQRAFIQTVLDAQEQLIITSNGVRIINANKAFFKFYQIRTVAEFMNTYGATCICDTFDQSIQDGFLQAWMGEMSWLDYVIAQNTERHFKARIVRDGKAHIFSVTAAALPGTKGYKSAVFTEITQIEEARKELEEAHRATKDSIEYASLIQHALIPDATLMQAHYADHFVIWKPRDTVGGDIYLFEALRNEHESLLMVIDCTGHGVPGAFVTMLVKAIERQMTSRLLHSDEAVSPAILLQIFNKSMKHLLKQESRDSISDAGFDGAILYYHKGEGLIRFASAQLPLFYVAGERVMMLKGDRHSIGYKRSDPDYAFAEQTLHVTPGMALYITTDGFLDQTGGDQGFSFGKSRFINLMEEISSLPMSLQRDRYLEALETYQGDYATNDDITLIGLRI
ncbi:MAG: transporter substrate-binding domain-containing protein [Campylobacterales bacterium]|nr:transporter substrate-binding domain-containing protein [Campylobacterales bacterium]